MDSASSPSTVASDAAARKIASRVRSPSARGAGGRRLSCDHAPLIVIAT
ncbi:MAG: hypothetical protein WBF34_20170 [Streptosporangiaceae bacterium]